MNGKITRTNRAFSTLVGERQNLIASTTLFITISPNPKAPVECIMKSVKTGKNAVVKRLYGTLPQKIQYEYCMKVFVEDYGEWFSNDVQIVGAPEFNKDGNVHFHIVVKDPKIRNEVQLQMLRRNVYNGVRTQQNMCTRHGKRIDWMNNIVFVTKSKQDIIDYVMKDQDMILEHFDNFYV